MSDVFTDLLEELGKELKLPLAVDKYNSCSIAIEPLTIQLELDPTQEFLFLFTKIIDLPPGKFRENILCEALKYNALPDPRAGVFGYVEISNHLALYQSYPVAILNGAMLSLLLGSFFELGTAWHSSIEKGQTPSLELK
jgi:hypothetical protein